VVALDQFSLVFGIAFRSQRVNLVVCPHFGARSARVVEDYRVGRICESSGIEMDARQYVSCHNVSPQIRRVQLRIYLPDVPSKMLTSSEAEVARWIVGTPESLRLALLLR
jgi:hypothetical protein